MLINKIAIGIDDGHFEKGKNKNTVIVGVKFNGFNPVSAFIRKIGVDRTDATERGIELIQSATEGINSKDVVVFLDGVTYAGFNFIDPEEIKEKTKMEIIAIFSRKPNQDKIENALRLHFSDWEYRWEHIYKVIKNVRSIVNFRGKLYFFTTIENAKDAEFLIESYQLISKLPEPIRVAHIIAKEISFFLIKENTI
ncbi:DUF99 family protein [Fervidicoccus fontis]|uniref:UPF0215 protein FFONT_0854 n=2 Tax=Fervidicoccus fontis TaxID=683846 RepID=I0A1I5_FERFK|nr:DUF99 family protein [Fervidicoccus fontis]AFH42842.1 hypothetical protein FFONT_0854 [Fervidicoccus fontis Kam940]MBE9391628.1 DUF99 family protein [Fervidicoccus fontis]PMB75973.1 MAG: DUF99 domain-containing protein [Fervidicoccus fontis]PMB77860.1 MAG: DUF99 domain-containing protein [Fervidicoccus fontis]HEW63578.1 DUF99 family protein [Fervidicoccus fontis]